MSDLHSYNTNVEKLSFIQLSFWVYMQMVFHPHQTRAIANCLYLAKFTVLTCDGS